MVRGSTLGFGDDLDIETQAEETTLHTAIDNMGKAGTGTRSTMRGCISFRHPGGVRYGSPSSEVVEIPDEVCNNYLDDDSDGKHDCEDSDCAEADVSDPLRR